MDFRQPTPIHMSLKQQNQQFLHGPGNHVPRTKYLVAPYFLSEQVQLKQNSLDEGDRQLSLKKHCSSLDLVGKHIQNQYLTLDNPLLPFLL